MQKVILDTDIGDDIDDTWALGMLLKSHKLDLKLVVTAVNNTPSKAKIVAKFLENAGRSDVPVGIGIKTSDNATNQDTWVADYKLDSYPGTVYKDGVNAMIDLLMSSDEMITIIALGPVTNLGEALKREPRIAKKARLIAMAGSIYMGYSSNKQQISAEYNVKVDIESWNSAFSSFKNNEITPLDTCGDIVLSGERYKRLLASSDVITQNIIANFSAWRSKVLSNGCYKDGDTHTSYLFDTVAVYMAITHDNLVFEKLPIKADAEGYTRISDDGYPTDCAISWVDKEAYLDYLTDTLCG